MIVLTVTPTPSFPLQSLLRQKLSDDWNRNLAMRVLVADYARHHLVIVIAAGCFAVLLSVLATWLLRRFRRTRKPDGDATRIEAAISLWLGVSSCVLAVIFFLVAVLDATDAFAPVHGFVGVVQLLSPPRTSADSQLASAFQTWVASGSARTPDAIQQNVHDRLTWQAPKAAVSGILIACFAALSLISFRAATRRSRRGSSWTATASLTGLGGAASALTFVAIVFFAANLAGSLAPLALTLSNL